MSDHRKPRNNGRFILLCFLGFFGFVGAVDGYFVYAALSTNTGLVTEHPYEKGLAYNTVLEKAKLQPKLNEKALYEDGVFQWKAADQNGIPIENADISVKFYRTVKDGHDFETKLLSRYKGLYSSKVDFPFPGLWIAKVSAQWNDKTYQTSHQIMVQ